MQSNVPSAQRSTGGPGPKEAKRKNETLNYEVNRKVSKIIEPTGAIKRLSVAVLVDGTYEAPEGEVGKVADGNSDKKYTARSEQEIQKLILARHESTKFAITFDESIKAYGAGDGLGSQVQSQFFRLLWGQSRGNPRSALMYWVSAITAPSENHIHVGVPSFVNSALVASMSDQALFLLAAIARHESLTHEELARVTNIENTVIRKCLKEAQDKNLIWIDEVERVRISSKSQYVIDYFLIGKNFLYE